MLSEWMLSNGTDALGHPRPCTHGLIMPVRGGLFEPLTEFEPGALDVDFLHVRETVADPFEEVGEIIDIIAWRRGTKSPWWMRRGVVTVIGDWELDNAAREDRPARMVATPADFVGTHGGAFCILNWNADLCEIIERAPHIECACAALEQRLRQTLVRQALPKIPISVAKRIA